MLSTPSAESQRAMVMLITGLLLFLGLHSVRIFAQPLREAAIARLGERGWRGVYSLGSLLGLMLVIWGYGEARLEAPVLYEPPAALKHLVLLLMLPALFSLVVYLLPAGRAKATLKHPMLLAVKIWALAHLLANGDAASLLLFGAFLLWAVLDRISVKRRHLPTPAKGPLKWDLIAVAITLVLYLLFLFRLHEWLFGVSPLPSM